MIDKDQVLSIVKENGPLIPRDVVKIVGGDTFITGAVLSTLVDSKAVRMSHAKIGGTPVYYVVGQEPKLEKLYQYLNEKDKKAYDVLKENKIIRDIDCDPLLRVALRNIRDFAKPLEVQIGESKEVFWKWHLFTNEESEPIIRQIITGKTPDKSIQREIAIPEIAIPPIEKIKEEEKPIPKISEKPKERPKEIQEKIGQEEKSKEFINIEDDFYSRIQKIFKDKGIVILETQIIRKKSDIEMIINIPTPVGAMKYFCKARDKKKSNDKDLSSIYVQSQVKKMPTLYITTGDLTKKAEEQLVTTFSTVTVLRI
ncbi:MAG: hypothetical protein ABIJ34_06955 [archaeon]